METSSDFSIHKTPVVLCSSKNSLFPGSRRQWQPTPILLPGKSHGWRSLVGCIIWGREESDTTEDFTFTFHFHALEKEMATHSSILAWRIPGTAEPGGLPSMGSHRVRHDWCDLTTVYNYLHTAPTLLHDSLFRAAFVSLILGSPTLSVWIHSHLYAHTQKMFVHLIEAQHFFHTQYKEWSSFEGQVTLVAFPKYLEFINQRIPFKGFCSNMS